MAEYRYYLIPDAMTRAFPEKFEKQTPTEFFDNIADLKQRYLQLCELPYNNERTWNERARFPYARLVVGIDRQNPDGAVASTRRRRCAPTRRRAPERPQVPDAATARHACLSPLLAGRHLPRCLRWNDLIR